MSARKTESEQTTKRSEPVSTTKTQNPSSCSEIILAILEFKNFSSNHPKLLSLGKAFRNATSEEEKVDIFYEAMASTSNLPTWTPLPPPKGCNPIGRCRFSQSISKPLLFQATRTYSD
ncbi:hypothetical protein TNCT_244801 [Trichonephila clavata]|uniref:Uncharacterized protein n=1 Tax=Trichonephila clavata TaxID=2740835 RepID=A0A8X6F3F4_TRICU|nr:hypothetical protein TNCT_244801 [Trichonephila clavata]